MKFTFKDYRLLNVDETRAVLEIRNSQAVWNASITSEPIALKDHQKWIKSLRPNSYFALILDSKIVGGISINEQFWGIFFDENTLPIIRLIFVYLFLNKLLSQVKIIKSKIKKSNLQALRFNEFFGFEICIDDGGLLYFNLSQDRFLSLESRAIKRVKILLKMLNLSLFHSFFKAISKVNFIN